MAKDDYPSDDQHVCSWLAVPLPTAEETLIAWMTERHVTINNATPSMLLDALRLDGHLRD